MAATTPRRSTRLPHTHTPKMSERKKSLFQVDAEPTRESLTTHRHLPVVDSESDSEECDLGIISTLDSSSGDENDHATPKKPNRSLWPETRSQTKKLLKETQDLKNFIKSPFTLKKYQTRYSCPDSKCSGSLSTPATPHFHNHPGTPSSTHSCTSVHTTSSTSSRARKSLASLIADTESCSSSLKDLNFDTDSGTDSKENTPSKSVRRSTRKLHNFKGILMEQKMNITSPMKTAVVCLTKMDMNSIISPTQMLKTPHNTTESNLSPPKLSHNRRSVLEIEESPESACDSEKSHKRLRNDSITETGPNPKYPRLDNTVPKARLSLFNSDRLKEILSAKSFYGKSNPEINPSIAAKISNAIEVTHAQNRRPFSHSHSHRRKRRPGQINSGVRHKIRKPKIPNKMIIKNNSSFNSTANTTVLNNSTLTNTSANDTTMKSQNSSQDLGIDKADPFDQEKQTIEALLSQWTEEEVPETELSFSKAKPDVPCFNSTVIEETNAIFQPVTAIPVPVQTIPQVEGAVIVELGAQTPPVLTDLPISSTGSESATSHDVVMMDHEGHADSHGDLSKNAQFLPVEGGYIFVDDNATSGAQEELPDLDEIERELKMLDEQILNMARCNNIDARAVLASTESGPGGAPAEAGSAPLASADVTPVSTPDKPQKLFSIFSNPKSGTSTPSSKGGDKINRKLLKTGNDQYVIDAGQKKFGATECGECGAIYQIGDPQDEHDHMVYHNATDVLKFNGWKDECVVERWSSGRIVQARGGGAGWRRVQALLSRVVNPQLGLAADLPQHSIHSYTAYLYIEKKQIIGCLVVEPKMRAYKMIPGDPDCCSVEDYPVKCGVSRVWVHSAHRRRGVARRMLECARAGFAYGDTLTRDQLAFSSPTPAGTKLAASYCGTRNFYVYLD